MNFEIKVNVELSLNEETKAFLTQLLGNKSMLLSEEKVPNAVESLAPPVSMELPLPAKVVEMVTEVVKDTAPEIVEEILTPPVQNRPLVTGKIPVKDFKNFPEVNLSGILLRLPTIIDARSTNGIRVHWEMVENIEDAVKYIVSKIIKQRPDIRIDSHTAMTANNLLWVYTRFNTIPKRKLNWKGWIYKTFPETAKKYTELDKNTSFVDPVPSVTKKESVELKEVVKKEEVKPIAKQVVANKKTTPVNEIAGIVFDVPMTKTLNGSTEFKWDEMGGNITNALKKIIITIADKSNIDVFSGAIMSRKGFGSVVGKFYTLKTVGAIDSNIYWADFVRQTLDEKTK